MNTQNTFTPPAPKGARTEAAHRPTPAAFLITAALVRAVSNLWRRRTRKVLQQLPHLLHTWRRQSPDRWQRVAIALCATVLLTPVLAQLRSDAAAPTSATGIDLLLIEHTLDGAQERTGVVHRWRYIVDNGGTHAVLCVDSTPDGDLIARDGFDDEVPSCQ